MQRGYPYKCRHCGNPYPTAFGAQVCFDLDMKEIDMEENAKVDIDKILKSKNTQNNLPLKPIKV